MRRRRLAALALSALTASAVGAIVSTAGSAQAATAFPRPTGYVVDAAGGLSASAVKQAEAELADYARRSGHQVAVALVRTTGGSIDNYAHDLFDRWGIGDRERDDGVLLLLALDDRQLRIEVGRGLEAELTDVEAGDIIRTRCVPPLRAGDVDAAVLAGERAIRTALGDPAGADAPVSPPPFAGFGGGESGAAASQRVGSLNLLPLLGLIVVVLLSLRASARRRSRRRGGFGLLPVPLFFGSGWGGGGFGGSSGGFGGFSGGSSGGGGASGGW